MNSDAIHRESLYIARQTLNLPIWEHSLYHLFLRISENNEVDTAHLISILKNQKKTLIISKTNFETNRMRHFIFDDETILEKNKYNIPEPLSGKEVTEDCIDVIFIPLMAFDIYGHRIGYGKGHYDKFLGLCRPNALKIGLSFFEAEPLFNEIYDSDVKMNYCVTPKHIYKF